MAEKTEFLMEKINVLRQQVQQTALNLFAQDLIIQDSAESTGQETVDASLKAQSQSAMAAVTTLKRQLAVRKTLLDKLQAEWDAQQNSKVVSSGV